ncbi:hypothetical protein ACLOJK_015800 [Asimina triloba]
MSISDEEGVGGTEGSVESENEGVSDSSACVQPISKFAETHNHKLETPVKAMKRWTRFAKKRPSIATCSSSSQLEDSPLFRCHMLTEQWLYLKNEALKRTSAFVIVKEHLEKAKAAILDLPNDGIVDRPEGEDLRIKTQLPTGAGDNVMLNPSGATHGILSGTLATHSSQTREILDPHIIQTKARTNKRYKSALKQRESTQNINLNEAESGKG